MVRTWEDKDRVFLWSYEQMYLLPVLRYSSSLSLGTSIVTLWVLDSLSITLWELELRILG